jgi:hypothetical protein
MSILARVAVASALGLVAGCSSSGASPATPTAGLTGALAAVDGSGPGAAVFGYTDLARLRALGVIDPLTHQIDARWRTAASAGFRSIANVVTTLPAVTAVDLTTADRAITVGDRRQAVRIDGGIHAEAAQAKIKSLGPVKRTFGDVDGYSFGGDDEVDRDSAIGAQLPVGNALNQIVLRGGTFAGSPDTTSLQSILGGASSLLEVRHYRDIARCLGDVLVAVIWPAGSGGSSVLLAAGVRDTPSLRRGHDEVVCSVPTPGRAADVRAAFTEHLSVQAVDQRFQIPVSRYATASHIDMIGPTVRATLRVKHDVDAGFVVEAYFDGAARDWDGV